MSEMLPLTGEVVFNKLMQPDVFMGNSKYTLTIALDKEGKRGRKADLAKNERGRQNDNNNENGKQKIGS